MKLQNLTEIGKYDVQYNVQYDDTSQGAIRALKDMSIWDTSKAKARPDPQVEGVWMITNIFLKDGTEGNAIVYLAGYPDPMGQIRHLNDFEDDA